MKIELSETRTFQWFITATPQEMLVIRKAVAREINSPTAATLTDEQVEKAVLSEFYEGTKLTYAS